ncbi:L-lactate permease [Alteromonas gilva]|uniref:L-lactate permease n=1 Tax=Alteromonas gilva TaxID=2987522 RepID=A0ABT5L2A6_9ALTE|nr:L-lactate permease [Alteromonas gilva]MDC8829928.1 L-lactate permease [Alteromonas gilva]
MLHLTFAYLPIVLLIYLMSKKHSMASSRALPLCALVVYVVVLLVYRFDGTLVHATVVSGLLMALTPVSIIAGAIFLFRTMEVSGALAIIRLWLNGISRNPIAQLMIIGWAFAFLIEGASGFGTPAAIAAPVLVSLGLPALRVAMFCLVLNTIPVTFGAVGTPIWFGFSVIELTALQLTDIAWQAALINAIAAPFVVFAGLALVIKNKQELLSNAVFILLSVCSCTFPYLIISQYSNEFPSLIGGMVGLIITIILAKQNIGLQTLDNANVSVQKERPVRPAALVKATFPLWATVLVLIVTRIQQLGLKTVLQSADPAVLIDLGYMGQFGISASLVLTLKDIFDTTQSWQHSLLYVPSILPFMIVGVLTLYLHRCQALASVSRYTISKIAGPFWALLGALVFVNLMMLQDSDTSEPMSPVTILGNHLASLTGSHWDFFAPFLGALGSFFSGSATISNLTFAGIQLSIAEQLGLSVTSVLAMQSVGAAMGNMVCINNIVAVTSILGLTNQDGVILKRTAGIMLLYGCLAGLVGVYML